MRFTITQRQAVLGIMVLLCIGSPLVSITQFVAYQETHVVPIAGLATSVLVGVLFGLYWRMHWEPARYILLVLLTVTSAFVPPEPFVTEQQSFTLFIPPALALILAGPIWVLGTAAITYTVMLARAGGTGVYSDPGTLIIYCIAVGGVLVGGLIITHALRVAEMHAQQAAAERTRVEEQARALEEANMLLEQQLTQQGEMLALITSLEIPVITLADGVLFAPVVGHMDSRRATVLTTSLLHTASDQRARAVILDIAGVTIVDTAVAQSILKTVQALRLLGCEVIISGISATVALTLSRLGNILNDVHTVRSPRDALLTLNLERMTIPSNGRG